MVCCIAPPAMYNQTFTSRSEGEKRMIREQIASERRIFKRTYWAAVLAAGVVGGAANAAPIDWDNETGNGRYLDPLNWSTNNLPVQPDDAAFVNTAAGPASIDGDVTNAPRDFRFGDDGRTGGGVVNHTAGNIAMPGWVRMGINTGSSGTYNLSGGTLTASNFRIAESGNTTATVGVTGGTLRQSDVGDIANGDNWARIGQDGAATFNLSNGAVSLDARVIVAGAPASTANITQTGGSFEVRRGEMTIGDQGTATYNITAGTLRTLSSDPGADIGGHITVGQWDNSRATLNIGGTALVEAGVNVQLADGRG